MKFTYNSNKERGARVFKQIAEYGMQVQQILSKAISNKQMKCEITVITTKPIELTRYK
jgi:predicted regulator of amino acid metabolism with ACT domain